MEANSIIWVSHKAGRALNNCFCFSQAISKEVDWMWSSWDTDFCPCGMLESHTVALPLSYRINPLPWTISYASFLSSPFSIYFYYKKPEHKNLLKKNPLLLHNKIIILSLLTQIISDGHMRDFSHYFEAFFSVSL